MSTNGASTGPRRRTAGRTAAILLAVALGTGGLTACGDSAGPEAGGVTTEDLQQVQDDLAALEDRIAVLEEAAADGGTDGGTDAGTDGGTDTGEPADDGSGAMVEDEAGVLDDAQSLAGQQVTVSAAVSEVLTSTDVGSAFRIGEDTGEPIAVLTATPTEQLEVGDVLRVSGTVTEIQRDTFESDFGIAADELFDDPDGFFSDHEGEVALSADRTEVLQEQSDG